MKRFISIFLVASSVAGHLYFVVSSPKSSSSNSSSYRSFGGNSGSSGGFGGFSGGHK